MTEKLFYAYEHWRPDTGQCFYVGKGRGRRSHAMDMRNRWHKHVQGKLAEAGLSVDVRIIASDLTESVAFAQEMDRIAYWRAQGVTLVNMTDGGDGIANPSEEIRARMRAAKVGRKLSAEHRAKIAESTRAALADPGRRAQMSRRATESCANPDVMARRTAWQKTHVRTEDHNRKIGLANKGKIRSPEQIERLRIRNLGRKQSHEEIERRRAANKGRKRSAEFCERMRIFAIQREAAHRAARLEMAGH